MSEVDGVIRRFGEVDAERKEAEVEEASSSSLFTVSHVFGF